MILLREGEVLESEGLVQLHKGQEEAMIIVSFQSHNVARPRQVHLEI